MHIHIHAHTLYTIHTHHFKHAQARVQYSHVSTSTHIQKHASAHIHRFNISRKKIRYQMYVCVMTFAYICNYPVYNGIHIHKHIHMLNICHERFPDRVCKRLYISYTIQTHISIHTYDAESTHTYISIYVHT